MTLYRFIASKQPLLEVDHRTLQVLAENEFKQLNMPSTTSFHFRLPDEPNMVIYLEDEAQLERLQIVKCNTFPEDTGEQIQRPYVYQWRGGIYNARR